MNDREMPLIYAHTKAEIQGDKPLDQQIGGSHYKDMPIQVVEFCLANNIPYMEGNVIKYTCRWAKKNGIQDLDKAIHYLQIIRQWAVENEN